ncbi:MAG: class I mannose-6-phosphate isomerase [Bryobacterales bacterium]|nr:class I mannose-6-phosphate isomerase [Bryobacterales bacterium]
MTGNVLEIEPKFVERVWGSNDLRPLFGQYAQPVGEVWFDAGAILIKFLFTSQPLSVQVHPDDVYARVHESGSPGKTEMWHVLRADPGAKIAVGFCQPVDREVVRQAALDGSIEGLLQWREVHPGDTFLTPAGTVHALGAGLVVCEIQQRSDVTYRLFDYNRGRELHLDKGLAVADLGPHPGKTIPVPIPGGGERLVECPYFVTERWQVRHPWQCDRDAIIILLEGSCSWGAAGSVWRLPRGAELVPIGTLSFLRTYLPEP